MQDEAYRDLVGEVVRVGLADDVDGLDEAEDERDRDDASGGVSVLQEGTGDCLQANVDESVGGNGSASSDIHHGGAVGVEGLVGGGAELVSVYACIR